jgi:hypothetical protein
MGTVKEQLWFTGDNYVYYAGSINGFSPSELYLTGNHLNLHAAL